MTKEVVKHDPAVLAPRTTSYEFFGPPGAFLVSTGTPFLCYAIAYACSEKQGGCPLSWSALPSLLVESVSDPEWWKAQWDLEGVLVYFGWYTFCIITWWLLPGDWIEGLPLRTGERVKYKINGAPHSIFLNPNDSTDSHVSVRDLAFDYGPRLWENLDHWTGRIHVHL